MDAIVYRLIRDRRPTPDGDVRDLGDLASLLLLAEDEDGERMSDEQARDEIVTMFFAGHETSANALTWAWILLAQHPDIEARMHEELDAVLDGRRPTAADYRSLELTSAVMKEALRLFPPAFTFQRVCVEETSLGGYRIPAGTDVSLVPYATHRDARFFTAPGRFDPMRFVGDRASDIDRYAFIPFGGGPRVCAGQAFALMETTLVLATIGGRFRLRLEEDRDVEPAPGVTLRPRGPVRMRVERRRAAAA
jgi:cytochrome P450